MENVVPRLGTAPRAVAGWPREASGGAPRITARLQARRHDARGTEIVQAFQVSEISVYNTRGNKQLKILHTTNT
eukprot:8076594-Pyramimonas_sp.AAC.1